MRDTFVAFSCSIALVACSHKAHVAPDAAESVDATPDAPTINTGPHVGPPQVMSAGGPVVAAPKVLPIFFMNDALQAQTEQFLTQVATSTYWTATTSEYGVGAMQILPSVVTTETAPTTDMALQTWLAAHMDGTHAGWPKPDGNTIYSVFLPEGVTLTMQGGTSCQDFGAYHDEGMAGTSKFIYALMPRCTNRGNTLDHLTTATSHELVEAATDPFPQSAGAYQYTDDASIVWSFTPGGELGDMCEYVGAARQRLVGTFQVQRTWSNKSAAAGHDPCVPAMSTPYRAAAPVLDDLSLDFGGGMSVHTKGIEVAVGASKTMLVDLISDGQTMPWTVDAIDAATLQPMGTPELSFQWDKTTGNTGDQLRLTVTRIKAGQGGGSELVIGSRDATQSVSLWWVFVK